MKFLFGGIVIAAALPMLTIYLSDLFLFDIPKWAAWPLIGVPLLAGLLIGVTNTLLASQYSYLLGRPRHHL